MSHRVYFRRQLASLFLPPLRCPSPLSPRSLHGCERLSAGRSLGGPTWRFSGPGWVRGTRKSSFLLLIVQKFEQGAAVKQEVQIILRIPKTQEFYIKYECDRFITFLSLLCIDEENLGHYNSCFLQFVDKTKIYNKVVFICEHLFLALKQKEIYESGICHKKSVCLKFFLN